MSAISEELRESVLNAFERLMLIPDEEVAKRPAPDKWSPKEIIGHLIDSASNNHKRFVNAQFTDHLEFDGYAQEEWVTSQRYQEENWFDLLVLWRGFNLHLAHIIENTPEKTLTKPRGQHNLNHIAWQTVPAENSTTLKYFMADYVGHLQHHLHQILE